MPSKIDSSILKALNNVSIDTASAQISSHGGSGFASTYRIATAQISVFVKTSSSSGAAVMFEGEHASLNAIHSAVPSLCPKSFAWGKLDSGSGYFLATEFLELGGLSSRPRTGAMKGSGLSLAQKLAKLHSTPAPKPPPSSGYDRVVFGFPSVTCCGDTPQPNDFDESWPRFFADKRLMAILERAEKNNGKDAELRRTVEEVCAKVVPRLLGDGHLGGDQGIVPVVTHGDLWSGNKGKGSFVGRKDGDGHDQAPGESGPVEDVVFDPSAAYAHHEYDHGIMNMFGGFSGSFWSEYFEHCPKTEPKAEYGDRVALYESYHHLNHYAIFGGSYKSGAMSLLRPLLKKYSNN